MEPGAKKVRPLAFGGTILLALMLGACGGDDAGTDTPADDAVEDVEGSAEEIEEAAEDVADTAEEQSADLATALRDNGMDSVASAVERIDFAELTDAPEFTFLAPNDEAFQSMDAEEIADLLVDLDALGDVLRNHVVPTRLTAADLATTDTIETEAGNTLDVDVDGDVVRIGDATVVRADIEVGDGVVHVVDTLYLP